MPHFRSSGNFHLLPHKQRGAVLMIMLVIVVMGAAAYLVSSLSASALKNARQETTAAALAQAKEALIGYAVKDSNRPGELPCPDIDNDGQLTMNVDYIGNQCVNLLGRLPWKTLGLPDLRDATGERLWYAVSNPFHANSPAVLNSDTAGTITIRNSAGDILYDGGTNVTGAVAVIIAPGEVLQRQGAALPQNRSCIIGVDCDATEKCTSTPPTSTPKCDPINYLDNVTAEDNADFIDGSSTNGFIQGSIKVYNPVTKTHELILNDQLMPITHDALFQSVEKVVGKRVRDLLKASRTVLGRFPFAASFTDPSASTFIATTGTYSGLLPGATAIWAATPGFLLNGGSADVSCELLPGNNSLPNARARCDISNITSTPTITMAGILNYLGLWSEYDLANANEVRVKVRGASCAAPNPASGITLNCAASAVPGLNAAISYTVNADRSVTVTFSGLLLPGVERIEMRDMVLDSRYDWITQNQWNRAMYYAVSSGHAPNGANTCNPLPGTPSCLTVNGNGGSNDKRAVIIMTGRALAGQEHPQSTIANYLEGENATPIPPIPTDFIYENNTRSNTFNDQVIIVAP